MLRKFSTKFKIRREDANGVNGVNGTNGTTHGVTNGTNGESKEKPALKERRSSFAPFKSKKETSNHSTDHNASRRDVENSFEQFAQIIHASVRFLIFLLHKHCNPVARHCSEATKSLWSPSSRLEDNNLLGNHL